GRSDATRGVYGSTDCPPPHPPANRGSPVAGNSVSSRPLPASGSPPAGAFRACLTGRTSTRAQPSPFRSPTMASNLASSTVHAILDEGRFVSAQITASVDLRSPNLELPDSSPGSRILPEHVTSEQTPYG